MQMCMDDNGFAFIIMVKGMKSFIHDQIRQQKGSFESSWGNQIAEFGVYGKTIHTFLYVSDTKKRYIHMYYSAAKAAGKRARFEENRGALVAKSLEVHSNKEVKKIG